MKKLSFLILNLFVLSTVFGCQASKEQNSESDITTSIVSSSE